MNAKLQSYRLYEPSTPEGKGCRSRLLLDDAQTGSWDGSSHVSDLLNGI